ncbi:MAG: hypothetical protein IKN04_13655 [Clostridia bacterium]|nr:hypothetical protein [Clostridia bacterium]
MSLWKDAQSPALKTEEAALLPALPRHMAQGAALKTVMQAGKRMGEMQLGASRDVRTADQPSVAARNPAVPIQPVRNRAALYQVWKR